MHGEHAVSTYVADLACTHLSGGLDLPRAVIPDFHERYGGGEADAAILAQLPAVPFVMFVGALRRIKGVQELLDSYESLSDAPPLVLIGTRAPDSPERYPPGVTVLYDVPNATVMEAWRRAMFGVAPSTLPEPLGNVIHEAMSAGRAVIGTRPGGHSDIIEHGHNGLLVPSGDVSALRDAMRRLIDDHDLRAHMGARARVTADRFTPAPALERFESLYGATIRAAKTGTVRRRGR
jgi:glycosyltransferase involved in cell wall biosynthesis